MPVFPWIAVALSTAMGAWWTAQRTRRLQREAELLAELSIRYAASAPVADGSEVVVLHRGVPVSLGFGVPEGEQWARGLVARAPYALGAGPRFTGKPRDVSSHARPMGSAYRLASRFERGYDVTGEHREARALMQSALRDLDTDALPAPYFVASASEVRVDLPEMVPDLRLEAGERMVAQLVALTGELALFGQDLLARQAAPLGGAVTVDRHEVPMLRAKLAGGGIDGELVLRYQRGLESEVRGFALELTTRRAPQRELDMASALAALDAEVRAVARQLLERGELSVEPGELRLLLPGMLDPDELQALHALMLALLGAYRDGPFR